MKALCDLKMGLYEKALPASMSWEERLLTAKQSGYDFCEISIDETAERMKRLQWSDKEKYDMQSAINNSGMPILTMCLSGNRRYTIGSENERQRANGIKLIKDAVEFSVDIGIRIVQLAAYDEFYNARSHNTERLFYEGLAEVTDYAAGHAVTLAFENMDTDFMDSISKIMYVINKINSPWLQIYPDVGNLAAAGLTAEQIAADFTAGSGHITAVHLKDTKPGIIRKVPYGEGLVDFSQFFTTLQTNCYQGLFVAEMWSDDQPESIPYVKTARDYLKAQMQAVQNRF